MTRAIARSLSTSSPTIERISRAKETVAIRSRNGDEHHLLRSTPIAILVFAALAITVLFTSNTLALYEVSLILVYSIAAVGQDWLVGRTGQISLGAAAFMAIGAFTTARLAVVSWAFFPIPLLVAGLFGGLVGLVVGVAGLRFRGLYLALSTLALQFVVSYLAQTYQGSNLGGYPVQAPKIGSLVITAGRPFDALLMAVLGLFMLFLNGMFQRAPGRAWSAIRQNETAATVAGVEVTRWKLLAFIGSSAITAVAGGLLAYQSGNVTYEPFTLGLAVSVLVMIFVGGIGSLWGAVVGATLVTMLPFWIQSTTSDLAGIPSLSNWLSLNGSEVASALYGLALVLVLLFERRGIVGLLKRLGSRVSRIRSWSRLSTSRREKVST